MRLRRGAHREPATRPGPSSTTARNVEGRSHLPHQDEVELLQEELGGFTTDRIFVDSLNVVVGLFAEGRR